MVLVVGATGKLGGQITRRLLENGHEVRILVREHSPSTELAKQGRATDALELIDLGAQRVYGDLKDRDSLDRALEGIETVVTTANAVGRGGDDTLETVDLKGTRSLIDASAAAEDVEHFVYISAAGSAVGHPSALYDAKGRNEKHLRESGLEYTILKPGVFMEVWIGAVVGIPLRANAPVTLIGQGDKQQAFVSMLDVAEYAVAAVENPAARNTELWIGGPRSYTWREAVEAVGDAVGRPLDIRYVAPGEPVPLLPEAMIPIMIALEMEDTSIDMHETAATYQVEPTPLDAFATRFFGT